MARPPQLGAAAAADGPHRLLDDAVEFVAERVLADGPQLKPAYTMRRGPVPDERPLRTLGVRHTPAPVARGTCRRRSYMPSCSNPRPG